MQLPIVAYGARILTKPCQQIDESYPLLQSLIEDMWDTLYGAQGCGLAAPQVNHPICLFLVDSQQTYQAMDRREQKAFFTEGDYGIKETFINARIVERSQEKWTDEEGCLSIPSIRGDVQRPWQITIAYQDRQFNSHTRTFSGLTARMIQHEYDHTEGRLYLNYLPSLQRTLLKGKLKKLLEGKVKVNYPMKYAK
jgi:peptide deformylase